MLQLAQSGRFSTRDDTDHMKNFVDKLGKGQDLQNPDDSWEIEEEDVENFQKQEKCPEMIQSEYIIIEEEKEGEEDELPNFSEEEDDETVKFTKQMEKLMKG